MSAVPKKQKQVWGKWIIAEGRFIVQGEKAGIPIRVMIQLPYNWHDSHSGAHTKKYWAARRKEKQHGKRPRP